MQDTGLHPWEIDRYTVKELVWQLHGARTRHAQLQFGARQIWIYVHNQLAKNKYRTIEQIHKVWPLYTDQVNKAAESPEGLIEVYRELKARNNN